MKSISRYFLRYLIWKGAIGSLFIFLLMSTGLHAQKICVKQVNTDPIWDGIVAGEEPIPIQNCLLDPVWSHVVPVRLAGTLSEPSHMYMARTVGTDEFLFIGFNIQDDGDLSDFDNILFFFDSDNSDSWNNNDCALWVSAVTFETQYTGSENCNIPIGEIKYWEYSDGSWGEPLSPAGLINFMGVSKSAYDLSVDWPSDDDEERIWEIEIIIPVNKTFTGDPRTYFPLSLGPGQGFGLCVYVFVDNDRQSEVVTLKWPSGIPDHEYLFIELNPPNPVDLGKTLHQESCFDVSVSSSDITLNGRATVARLSRTGINRFEAQLFFDGPGTNVTPLSNSNNIGEVDFYLCPVGGGAWILIKTESVTFTQYNNVLTSPIRFDWRVSDLPNQADRDKFYSASHSCMKVELRDFKFDDDFSNNRAYHNDLIIEASEVRETLRIDTAGIPREPGQEFAEVYIKVGVENLGEDFSLKHETSSHLRMKQPIGILGSYYSDYLSPFQMSLFESYYSPYLSPLQMSCFGGYYRPSLPPSEDKRWGFSFPNAEKIGLKQVRDKTYKLRIRFGEHKQLEYSLIAGKTPYEAVSKTVSARSGESIKDPENKGTAPVQFSVTPGSMVTVLASGTVDLDGDGSLEPTGPGGFTVTDSMASEGQARYAYPDTSGNWLLPSGYYNPSSYAGALLGSFDEDFETAFVIGAEATFLVPEEQLGLYLTVNDTDDGYANNVGKFSVDVILTTPKVRTLPTRTPEQPANPLFGIPAFYAVGSNLVTNIIQTYYTTERRTTIDGVERTVTSIHPLGFVRLHISKSHIEPETSPVIPIIYLDWRWYLPQSYQPWFLWSGWNWTSLRYYSNWNWASEWGKRGFPVFSYYPHY